MRSPHERRHLLEPRYWLWLLSLALSSGGILLGLHMDDYHLVNRSAAVMLLVIALACVRDILA
jgi:hypothetical protein